MKPVHHDVGLLVFHRGALLDDDVIHRNRKVVFGKSVWGQPALFFNPEHARFAVAQVASFGEVKSSHKPKIAAFHAAPCLKGFFHTLKIRPVVNVVRPLGLELVNDGTGLAGPAESDRFVRIHRRRQQHPKDAEARDPEGPNRHIAETLKLKCWGK